MNSFPTMTEVLTELTRRRAELVAVDDRLKVTPASAADDKILTGIRHHEVQIRALLQRFGPALSPPLTTDTLTRPRQPKAVNPRPPAPGTRNEQQLLDRLPPSARPRIEAVKKQFPDLGGVEVVEVTTVWARRAAELLAGLEDDRLRVLFRDLFEERAAICEHDAGLPMVQAEQMAYQELLAMVENLDKDAR